MAVEPRVNKELSKLVRPDFLFEASAGTIYGLSVVHKFGRATVGTTFTPVALGGIYRTPQVGAATTLRVKAGNANDDAAGTGARSVTLIGLDATGAEATEEIPTAGISAGASSSTSFIRLYRAYVSKSGTYATQAAGSHAADIFIENSAGTEDWAKIELNSFPKGQTEIGVYSVPLGYTAYIRSGFVHSDTSKPTHVILFSRENILETAAPYSSMNAKLEIDAAAGGNDIQFMAPLGPFPELSEFGFMGKVDTGTAEVDVNMEIILVKNS